MNIKNYIDKILIVSFIVILCIIGYIVKYNTENINNNKYIESTKETNIETVKETKSNKKEEDKYIYVHVSGEVKKQGMYKLKYNSRIDDVIKLADGFTKYADISRINLSQKLKDEMKIHVYKIGDLDLKNNLKDYNKSGRVNINIASLEELMTLSGVGKTKAESIIKYRENKIFQNVNDIKNVTGIGDKLFEKIKENIEVD